MLTNIMKWVSSAVLLLAGLRLATPTKYCWNLLFVYPPFSFSRRRFASASTCGQPDS